MIFYNYLTRETLGWAMKTAYSNGRNRMKFSENKWSIPGKVKLVKDYVGKISVFSEDANIEGYLPMYMNICNHDKDPLSHCCITDTWNAIQKRAIGYLDAKELQNEIIISDQVKDEIENIRESFKCNM
jgi:nicotinamide phosphoribosyltransferase